MQKDGQSTFPAEGAASAKAPRQCVKLRVIYRAVGRGHLGLNGIRHCKEVVLALGEDSCAKKDGFQLHLTRIPLAAVLRSLRGHRGSRRPLGSLRK